MFGAATRDTLTPQPERSRLELTPHERDHRALCQAKLQGNRVKRRAIFPSHFNDSGHICGRKSGGLLCLQASILYQTVFN